MSWVLPLLFTNLMLVSCAPNPRFPVCCSKLEGSKVFRARGLPCDAFGIPKAQRDVDPHKKRRSQSPIRKIARWADTG